MRILNWNTQADRHKPDSDKLRSIRERVAGYDADVICRTEAYPEAMPDGEHTTASGLSGWGWPEDRGARKVLLWSHSGWTDIDRVGSPHLPPGRFVSASTGVDGAQWKIVGMCIPYDRYRGNAKRWGEQRKRNWQGACEYLEVLRREVMADECYQWRTIFLGDFNLLIPPKNYPYPGQDVNRIRNETFRGLSIPTAGEIDDPALGRERFIDHIALTPDIRLRNRRFFSRFADEGVELSDHNGACIEVDEIAEREHSAVGVH